MKSFLTSLLRNKRGATAIEYGLICALIVIAVISAIRALGTENGGAWTTMSSKAVNAMASAVK